MTNSEIRPYKPEVVVDSEALVQCTKREDCLSGNNGWLPRSAFNKHTGRKNGLQYWCKKCANGHQHAKAPTDMTPPVAEYAQARELPPPDGVNAGKPYWTCTTVAGVVNRKHGSVYNHFEKGEFGAFRVDRTYVVYEKGFRQAIRWCQQRDEMVEQQRARAAQQVLEFAEAVPNAEPAEIAEALLPFIETVVVQQKPADVYAALDLLVEAITCDFQRRAHAHELELTAYWDQFVPDVLREAITLAQEYLDNNK